MNKSVLLFQPDPETDSVLADALSAAGFRVSRKKSLSGMHNQLSSLDFDAVLVEETTLSRFGVAPGRHLWEHSSPQSILAYSAGGGTCLITRHSRSGEGADSADAAEKAATLARIESVVRNVLMADAGLTANPESRTGGEAFKTDNRQEGATLPSPVFGIPLQKKLAGVLESLVKAGGSGADIQDITKNLWGTAAADRKKDIQIYMTRLRHALDGAFPGIYRIRREGNRYILEGSEA